LNPDSVYCNFFDNDKTVNSDIFASVVYIVRLYIARDLILWNHIVFGDMVFVEFMHHLNHELKC